MTRIVSIFCCLLLLAACESSKKLSNQNLSYLYAPGLNYINPEYRICNIGPDTSRVFFRAYSAELLFMKADESGIFKCSFAVSYQLLSDYESKVPVDSGTVYFENEQDSLGDFVIHNFIDVRAPDSSDYIIQLKFTDINRQQAVASFLTIDRTGIQPAQNFMVLDAATDLPFYGDFTDAENAIRIGNPNSDRKQIYLRYFKLKFPLSRPPFSEEEEAALSYRSDETRLVDLGSDELVYLQKTGIYHFQYDTLVKEGLTIFRFEEDFPRLTVAESLIESIRFLTTREEYDKIRTSTDKKQAVDDYWLSMAGNRERARVLIRSYYSRVQYANLFFTSYIEGWKTDRGLIYIIFGPPSSVYRDHDAENWNYSQVNNYGPLNFTFEKINNPFTMNDYRLRRSIYYELPWYRAVDTWRDGRVVNESQ